MTIFANTSGAPLWNYTGSGTGGTVGQISFLGFGTYNYFVPNATVASVSPAAVPLPTVSGLPAGQLNNVIYGKDIPIFVGGIALIGGRICEGPYFTTVGGAQVVSFIVSLAVAANPGGTRTITSVSLNGTVSWTAAGGSLIAGMTVNTRTGTETQTPFASSTARDGLDAIAYRSHILVEVLNCPLAPFSNVIPFVSGKVEDSTFGPAADGITRNDALTVLANYAGYANSEISISVGGLDTFWIVAGKSTFIQLLQQFQAMFRRWNIVTSDKLYIFESDDFAIDVVLTRSNTIKQSIAFTIDDPLGLSRELVFGFIDINRDNEPNTAAARLDITPIPTTQSIESKTIALPVGTTAPQATADAYTALYFDDIARRKMACTGMLDLLGIQAGDATSFTDDLDIVHRGRVVEIARSVQNWTCDLKTEAALECIFAPSDPFISNVKLLLGFEDVDNSTGAPGFTDESPAAHGTAVVTGGPIISTGWAKFGGSSYLGNGSGSATFLASADFGDISPTSSSQFTIECWTKHSGTTITTQMLFANFTFFSSGWILWCNGSGNGELEFSGTGWSVATSGLTWVSNQVYAIAVDKDASGKVRIYRDGAMVASSAPADSSIPADPGVLYIGTDQGGRSWNGGIDEARITKGVARYASDAGYTVPTVKFPRT